MMQSRHRSLHGEDQQRKNHNRSRLVAAATSLFLRALKPVPLQSDWGKERPSRSEASHPVTTLDMQDEVDRFRRANNQIIVPRSGNYL